MTAREFREYLRDKLELHGLAVQKVSVDEYVLVNPKPDCQAGNWPAVLWPGSKTPVDGTLNDIKDYLDTLGD